MSTSRRNTRTVQRELREQRRNAALKKLRRSYLIACALTGAVFLAIVAMSTYEVVHHASTSPAAPPAGAATVPDATAVTQTPVTAPPASATPTAQTTTSAGR